MSRYAWLEQILGADSFSMVTKSKVLVVGAGGIGCELLKNLVLSGFLDIFIIDLDTIDLSNLNRQFLFQKQHISKSKAHVARESALRFNPNSKIVSHHGSIMSPEFNQDFFKGFDLVLNALDNLAARRHVNRLCLAADVPLVESGTEGFLGQVSVIKKGETECFECQPKPTPKTFPVCTIRSTPSAPIHCVVWAKQYLFGQLFGKAEENEENADVDPNSENAEELKALKKEAEALKELRSGSANENFGELVFDKVFNKDIERLLGMKEMWKSRKPPTPLEYQEIRQGLQSSGNHTEKKGLRDQQIWTLEENYQAFLASVNALGKRTPEEYLSFDKDDKEMLDFVTATSNLRAHVFGIDKQSRFKVKEMAGNIIPAIATTNAIIAGLMVLQAFYLLAGNIKKCSTTYLVHGGRRMKLLMKEPLAPPNKYCYVCQNKNLTLKINNKASTLQYMLEAILIKSLAMVQPAISEITPSGARLLYDIEFDDNLERTLADLGINDNSMLNVEDEGQDLSLVVTVKHSEGFDPAAEKQFEIVGGIPIAEKHKIQIANNDEGSSSSSNFNNKRKLDEILDDDLLIVENEGEKGKKKTKN